MTRLFKIATISMVAIAMTACNTEEKQITRTALGYLQATAEYNIDEAMPYACKETRETTLTFLRDKLLPITDTAYIAANTPAEIKIDSITMAEDTVWVYFTKDTPIQTVKNALEMIKEDGKWLVYVPLQLPDNLLAAGDNVEVSFENKE